MRELAAGDQTAILFLAYHFPPLGGAGTQRSLKFVRYLPEFGYLPVVVTGPDQALATWPPPDPTMLAQVPLEVPVYRLGPEFAERKEDHSPSRMKRLLLRIAQTPTASGRAWIRGAMERGRRAAANHSIALVYATMSPFESCHAASHLARELQVPWVADLRDPWALDEMMVFPSRLQRNAEKRRMGRALSSAARVIMNTPDATRALREAFPELGTRAETLTNGFDAEDFRIPPAPRDSGVFQIVHTGHLHARLGERHRSSQRLRRWLGGERVEVDVMTRSHVFLLRALERWRAERPEIRGQVELVLVGAASETDRQIVQHSSARDLVRFEGYLDHASSIAQLRAADLLFLPMQNLPRGVRSRIVPGKTYEYLAAGVPILAAVPEGDARDLVRASGMGEICEPDDVEGMLEILERRYEGSVRGEAKPAANPALLAGLERRALTQSLAAIFSSVIDEHGATRGTQQSRR